MVCISYFGAKGVPFFWKQLQNWSFKFTKGCMGGVTFHSLLVTCWNSLVARYSLKFTRCSLLVVKSLVARCKIQSLLVVEVARCKIRSLLVAKFVCYSLQKITRCLLQEYARYSLQKLLVPKNHWFSLQNSLDTHCKKSFFVKTITCWNYCLFKVNKVRWKF